MSKITKQQNILLNIFNRIASKRFSKNEKMILVFLSIIAALAANHMFSLWINSLKVKTPIVETITPPESLKLPAPIIIKKEETPLVQEKPIIRDPFLSSKDPNKFKLQGLKKQEIDLKLSGVLWDEKIPTAIINSKVVKIGDLIAGKTVVDIEKDKVVLMEEGHMLILKLRKK